MIDWGTKEHTHCEYMQLQQDSVEGHKSCPTRYSWFPMFEGVLVTQALNIAEADKVA